MTFTVGVRDTDYGVAPSGGFPDGRYRISAWGFSLSDNRLKSFGELLPSVRPDGSVIFGGLAEIDFSLIAGSNTRGQLGTYQLNVGSRGHFALGGTANETKGFYFRIEDQNGNVSYIGAGGLWYKSLNRVIQDTIPFGGDTINFP